MKVWEDAAIDPYYEGICRTVWRNSPRTMSTEPQASSVPEGPWEHRCGRIAKNSTLRKEVSLYPPPHSNRGLMSYLLQMSTRVLVVGEADALQDDVCSAVCSGTTTAVEQVPSATAAAESVANDDSIGCVLLADPGDDQSLGPSCDAIHDDAPILPVIAYVDDGDGTAATAVASRDSCRYLPRDADPSAVRAVVDDALETCDRRRRERAESSLFDTLLKKSDVPIFAKDVHGRHVYKSGVGGGEANSDVVGKTDLEVSGFNEEKARQAYEDDMHVVKTGAGIYEQEEKGGSAPGEYWSLVTKVPWRDDDGDVQGLVGLTFDITPWKERERQFDAQKRRVDQFTNYLRHDLRTPLQVAYGAVELAREGEDGALDTIERAHDRMMEVIDDLAGGSGVQTTQFSDNAYDAVGINIKSVYLVRMIEDLWRVVGPDEATLAIELPADAVVIGQSERIRPMVENLLKNAVEHCGPGVNIRIGMTNDRGFFIEDDGPGISADLATAITDEDLETTNRLAGTGLLIVLDAVHELGWSIEATEAKAPRQWQSEYESDERTSDLSPGTRFELSGCTLIVATPADATPTKSVDLSTNTDVGDVAIPGSARFDPDADQWNVTGCGKDVWGDTNQFHFVYGTATAPARIQGRVDGLDGIHPYSKAGFVIRGGVDASAPFGYVGTTKDHGSEVTWRFAADAMTGSDQFEERPIAFEWYRVDYADGEVTCYLSEDGSEWHAVDQRSIDLGEEVYLGMLVSSHDPEKACEARFRNVQAWELERSF